MNLRDARRRAPGSDPKPEGTSYVAVPRGVEAVAAAEITELGGREAQPRPGGVGFHAGREALYRILIAARCVTRLYERLGEGEVRDGQDLYDAVVDLPWERWLPNGLTFAVDATIKDSDFNHSGFVALKTKDAIVDRQRRVFGARSNIDRKAPDMPVKVLVEGERLAVFRELGGASLHKRGWRPVQVKSPLNEALAAGLLRLAEWRTDEPLIDPCCGSGTLLIEAADMARGRAPRVERRFAAERWPDTDQELLRGLRQRFRDGEKDRELRLLGADHHAGALSIARRSAAAAGVEVDIRFQHAALADLRSPWDAPVVVTNPPYGERLGSGEELAATWKDLGSFLKRAPGARAYVLCGDSTLTRDLKLKAAQRWPVMNGSIDCRLLRYDMY